MDALLGLFFLALISAVFARAVVWFMEEPVDGAMRNYAPGLFVGLSEGVTHYRLEGPDGAPVILCIHGLTTPSFVWDAMAPALVAKGFRVLRYDHYGRGFSDRPRGRYDTVRHVRQAVDLMDALGIEKPVIALGYSMGGAVATALAQSHPKRVRRLILLASGGLGSDLGRFAEACAKLPVLGDWAYGTLGGWLLRRDAAFEDTSGAQVPDLTARIQDETYRRGYLRAVLSSLRHILNADQYAAHKVVADAGIPVLAIWGEADPVIPLQAMGRLAQANRNARQEVIEGAGHNLPTVHTSAVLQHLIGTP